jgi:hypothetical protein
MGHVEPFFTKVPPSLGGGSKEIWFGEETPEKGACGRPLKLKHDTKGQKFWSIALHSHFGRSCSKTVYLTWGASWLSH